MENNIVKSTTESGKKLQDLLKSKGLAIHENDVVAFCYEEHEDTGYITYNYNSTGICVNRADINEADLEKDGFKIWRTWYYKF